MAQAVDKHNVHHFEPCASTLIPLGLEGIDVGCAFATIWTHHLKLELFVSSALGGLQTYVI